ncbi:MAG: hypothetical protein KBE41_03875 [Lutibacter sp.]|mgnify:CR=1 FL=1|nr:hypothetical protein [Lutibacter sp.]MBP9600620.1 hypothetical protein [Lutibacter sp.]
MKKTLIILLLLFKIVAYSQFSPIKNFDYKLLEGKVLYIPQLNFDEDSNKIQRFIKNERFDKIATEKEKIEEYNRVWKLAMEQSTYNATPYEIVDYNYNDLRKAKDPKVLILRFYVDGFYNNWVSLVSIGPEKTRDVARALITGIDLTKVEDIRLMVNMLNFSLNEASELQENDLTTGYSDVRNNYKKNFLAFYEKISELTFLAVMDESDNGKKAERRNEDVEEALKDWNLSKSEIISSEELQKKRLNKEKGSYYWRSFAMRTQSPLIVLQMNVILNTENDEVYFFKEWGSRRLKGSTIMDIQDNIKNRAERYKKQLEAN